MTASASSVSSWVSIRPRFSHSPLISDKFLSARSLFFSTTAVAVDILSNGFKIRGTNAVINTDNSVYIYAAFAEAPLVNSEGVPCNAR